ncbi:MAG TPA: MATE family efflux transporter [Candidatus Mediterraneibacter merdigallinarum]|nr:MATE family efflux transporter [Candidatus Mediterraneibacter merdigallinarum]
MKAVQSDMTTGSPMKIIFNFTLPIFIGNVFQQFYNMADAVIVGKFVGNKALAAVGSTGTIMFLIYGFVVGMTAGFTVLTAQKFGAGDMPAMRRTVVGASFLSLVVGLVLTAAFMVFMKPWLVLMHTPEDIFADAYAYIMIISAGILAQMLYNLLASILRALGNSKVPLYFLILAALLNIVLDLVLIIVFHMGAAGAAVATVISQGISGVLCLFYIIRKVPLLRLTRDDRHLSGDLLRTQIRIGIPMALQYSITAVGTMMVQSALNILGSTLVAAYTAAGKIEQIVTQAYVAMGTTMATYGAQNMGAGDVSRIRQGFKASTIIGVIYAIVSAALVMTVGKYMTYLFVSEDVALIMDSVNTYLICVGIFFIPLAIVNIYRNGIQGLGYGLLPMMAGVAELVGRGVVAVIAAGQKSYLGVCLASPAAWVLASLLLIGMYYYVVKIDLKKIFPDKYAGNKKKSGLRSR